MKNCQSKETGTETSGKLIYALKLFTPLENLNLCFDQVCIAYLNIEVNFLPLNVNLQMTTFLVPNRLGKPPSGR